MLIKTSDDIPLFEAADGCLVAEVIHPRNDGTTPRVSLARATVRPGRSTRPHRLDMVEIYYVLEGRGLMFIDGESREVEAGQAVYIPVGAVQHIKNTGSGGLSFLCVCAPAYDRAKDHPA